MRPREALIAVTYACNARCSMCNIWKCEPEAELEVKQYSKLPSTLRTINITGGEPFLRKDLVEVVREVDLVVPSVRLVFSTNGLATDLIVSRMEKMREFHKRLGAGISIDGMEETHDRIRGVPGIFSHAVRTVQILKDRGFRDLRIAMTLQRENYGQLGEVYSLSKSLGVEFTMTLAHNSGIYFQKTDNFNLGSEQLPLSDLSDIMRSQLASRSVKEWLRAYHTKGIADAAHRRGFVAECEAGRMYFFMTPSGDVYPCNVMNKKIGNITQVDKWDSLFTKDVRNEFRKSVRACTNDCWMICNTRSLIISHPVKVGVWIAKNKAISYLGQKP